MRAVESVVVPAPPAVVFPFVLDLGRYPDWLRLVHQADPVDDPEHGDATWTIELRARVGPFARSKQLRMERVEVVTDELVVFERHEIDAREHARWALRVELAAGGPGATILTMHLAYDGALWTGGLLERVLDDEIRSGRAGLIALISDAPKR